MFCLDERAAEISAIFLDTAAIERLYERMYGAYWLLIICARWSWRDAYDHLDDDHPVSLFPEP